MLRSIKKLHEASFAPIDNLITYRALPSIYLQMGALDPFLFLNHHGPQQYKPNNTGLPFGPHPHRGFETVTFILQGDIMHQDSGGYKSTIQAGGIQWMTAGSGLIHSEVSSEEFKANGGPLEILQLWLNLPGHLKMTEPKYTGLQADEIPLVSLDEDKVTVHLVSGSWGENKAPIQSLTDVQLSWIDFKEGGQLATSAPAENTLFLYVVKGKIKVNGYEAEELHLVEFYPRGEEIEIQASADSIILFGHAKPYGEKIVAYGPFVMNSEDEIQQAYQDFQEGKFGTWIA
ncbi:pirin family protein [Adhaeribacter aquaticus]|uniref:pirin family protein n=1 Tax=Adhaeribacter aquaticus TaxID=299567 RepID=UPI0004136D8A|nr:pirin family protein [Adhaeribacter aquaticus]